MSTSEGQVVGFGELLLRPTPPGPKMIAQTQSLDVEVGGAEANVLAGLACLGHSTKMLSCVADNPRGRLAVGTPALGPGSAEAARAAGVPISFDGNFRPQLWSAWDSDPKTILTEIIGKADLLFGNHRDIGLLTGDFPAG